MGIVFILLLTIALGGEKTENEKTELILVNGNTYVLHKTAIDSRILIQNDFLTDQQFYDILFEMENRNQEFIGISKTDNTYLVFM